MEKKIIKLNKSIIKILEKIEKDIDKVFKLKFKIEPIKDEKLYANYVESIENITTRLNSKSFLICYNYKLDLYKQLKSLLSDYKYLKNYKQEVYDNIINDMDEIGSIKFELENSNYKYNEFSIIYTTSLFKIAADKYAFNTSGFSDVNESIKCQSLSVRNKSTDLAVNESYKSKCIIGLER